jgi:hypothetical protein
MKHALALSLCLLAPVAHASEMIEVGELPVENKILIVVAPDAAKATDAIGQNAWVTLALQLGNFTGLRAQFIPFHGENFSVAVEGFAGASFLPEIMPRETFGGGVRVSFTAAADAEGNDALLVSPGVDFYFLNGTPGRGLSEYSGYGHVYYLATNADVSWVHQFSKHFAFELGARVGAAVAVNDGDPKRDELESLAGQVVPELGLFTGVRF